jgi:hypothetical protein
MPSPILSWTCSSACTFPRQCLKTGSARMVSVSNVKSASADIAHEVVKPM